MKRLLLLLSLLAFSSPVGFVTSGTAFAEGISFHKFHNAKSICACPPDCHCHKSQGGDCPDDECLADCDCDMEIAGQSLGYEIHPSMLQAIRENEKSNMKADPNGLLDGRGDYIMVKGQKQFTGFRPTAGFYRNRRAINLKAPKGWVMKPIDYSGVYSPVQGQIQGSCWAEGCGSVMDLAWNAALGTKFHFSVQDVIDCSGYGTARGGGQLSVSYAQKAGLALEEDYHYTGRDGRCDKNADRIQPLKDAPILRGEDGKFPTELEINYALHMMGPFEVCGSASALKDGGIHTELPSNGATNHCYAHGGMKQVDGVWVHGIKNSWGDDGTVSRINPEGRDWGANPPGWGWYRLAKEPGGKILGSVITEIQVAETGLPVMIPAGPIEFSISDVKADLQVVIEQGALYNKLQVEAAISSALKTLP